MSTQITMSRSGSGLQGVHSILKLNSGDATSNAINAGTITNSVTLANSLAATPYIPAQTFTTSNFYINVASSATGALARILIYSDVNGLPNTKLYESADLDCSTIGIKTAITSFTFTAGVVYWLVVHTSSNNSFTSITTSCLMAVRAFPASTNILTGYRFPASIGSAPAVWNNFNSVQFSNLPAVFITVA